MPALLTRRLRAGSRWSSHPSKERREAGEETSQTLMCSLPQLHIKVCDVSSPASRRSLLGWLDQRLPALNLLVNNAGIQRPFDFLKGPRNLPSADEEIRTNLAAPLHLSALLIPRLRRRRQAAIVNISSG